VFSVKVKCQDLLGLVGLAKDGVGGLKAIDSTYSLVLIVECSPLSIDVHVNEVEVDSGDGQCWAVLTFFLKNIGSDFLCLYVRIGLILIFFKISVGEN
jgi:hypothetical protein